jgi:hypothetical protein
MKKRIKKEIAATATIYERANKTEWDQEQALRDEEILPVIVKHPSTRQPNRAFTRLAGKAGLPRRSSGLLAKN